MKRLLYALAGILVFASQVMGANSTPADCISKMQSLSTALRVFRAEFDVVDDKIALPKEVTDAELQQELSLLDEQAKRQPGSEQEKFQREKRKEMAVRRARAAAVTASRQYRAVLYVKGNYIRWEEPEFILSYNGKKATIFLTRPNPQPNYISSVRIFPTLLLVDSQPIPFYGVPHPAMPMFAIEDLKSAKPSQRKGFWAIRATNRYGIYSGGGLIRFDSKCRVQDFDVFVDDQHFNDRYLRERWRFLDWRQYSGCDFPSRIEAEFFTPPPLGVKPPLRTALKRRLTLSLLSFSNADLDDEVFDFQKPPVPCQVQDDRYKPSVLYTRWGGDETLDQLSERYYRRPQGYSTDPAKRAITAVLLLAVLGGLWMLRSRLTRSRPVSQPPTRSTRSASR